jgi:hypothetical protein
LLKQFYKKKFYSFYVFPLSEGVIHSKDYT